MRERVSNEREKMSKRQVLVTPGVGMVTTTRDKLTSYRGTAFPSRNKATPAGAMVTSVSD